MTLRNLLLVALLSAPGLAVAAPSQLTPIGTFLPTRLPFTYILDYDTAAYFAPGYAEQFKVGPPALLHLGTVTPCHSYFGPAYDAAAAEGKAPYPPIQQFVAQYRQRLNQAKAINHALRAEGVGKVVAYVCMMTSGGDPQKRTGLWHFYDNWQAFTPLGAGPKPAADPITWQQRKPDGSEQHYYPKNAYMPMFYRYANCVNNPNWRQYMAWVIRGAAQAGFDGVFVDNAGSEHCYCKYCREGFARYLKSRYTPAELHTLFHDDLSLSTDGKGLRGAESKLFWDDSIHNFLNMLQTEGSKIRPSFYIFPNGCQGRPLNLEDTFRDCNLAMYEHSVGTFGTNPGRTRSHIIAGIYISHVNDNIFAEKLSAAIGAPCRSAMLTRPGYPHSQPGFEMNPSVAALGLAEAAAFSGGGCFLHRPPRSAPKEGAVRQTYNAFFASHRDWYQGYYPYGTVGVLTMLATQAENDRRHLSAAKSLIEELTASHVLADPVTERRLNTDLSGYRTIIVPALTSLPDVWLEKLRAYRAQGGKLVIDQGKQTATLDQLLQPRAPAAIAAFQALGAPLPVDPSLLTAQGGALQADVILPPTAEYVRGAVYANDFSRPTRLLLHLVNYDVALGVKGGRVGSLSNLAVTLPLPAGVSVGTLRLAAPGQDDMTLPVKQRGRTALFTIPHLDIYAVCWLDLQRGGNR